MPKIRPAPELELEDADGNVYPLAFPSRLQTMVDGLGMPPIQHWTTRSPYQDGRTHWGYAIQPRVVNMVLYLRGCDRADMYTKRRANVAMMSPRNGPHKLRLITPDLLKYELHDGWVTSGYTLSSDDQPMPQRQVGGVQFTFYDPIWKWVNSPLDGGETRDAEGRTCIEDDTFTTADALVLGFTGPYLLGTTQAENTITPVNDGSWAVNPVITITGPVYDWILSNATNGTFINWDGYEIASGETVEIDIGGGTVTSSVSGDVSTYLSGDTGSFELEPGSNTINFFASGGVVNLTTTIAICWYVELLGA
jgi:hypothetical protein